MTIAASTLDIVNVAISACIPLAIFAAGALLAKQAREYEANQWVRRKQYDTRLERWQEISPSLNDLLCFFMYFGHFKEITPPDVIKLKRQLDRAVFANQQVFGETFLEAYKTFMSLCFAFYAGGPGHDAKIRASVVHQRLERGSAWREDWAELLVAEDGEVFQPGEISAAYNELFKTYDEL